VTKSRPSQRFCSPPVMAPPAGCSFWVVHPAEESTDSGDMGNWSPVSTSVTPLRGTTGRATPAGSTTLADTFCAGRRPWRYAALEPLRGRSEIVAFPRRCHGEHHRQPLASSRSSDTTSPTVLFNEVTRDHAQVVVLFHRRHPYRPRPRRPATATPWYPTATPGLIKHRKVSTDWAAPDSAMARPSR